MSATIVQVTNVSPSTTSQQLKELFSYLGDIQEIKLYPEDEMQALSVPSKVCFVNFKEKRSAASSLHLTNTVLIDRALIVARSRYATIPDSTTAMSLAAPAIALANSSTIKVGHTAPLLPTPPSMSSILGSALSNIGPAAAAFGAPALPIPSPLISLMGTVVPQPPPLTGNVDPTKIEEIRRTIYVGNLGSDMTAEQVLTFFQPCGEIKYVRMAGDETQPTRFAFVEFATPESVPIALQYNGAMFGDRPIKVNHSKNAIVKPQGPSAQETQRDVDEAMKKVKEAMMDIEARVVPATEVEKVKSRSRSRSRDKHRRSRSRSHSRSRDRRRRSRTRSRSRDRFKRRSRSRSPGFRYSGSRGNYGRSSPSFRGRHHRSRSRSPPRRMFRGRRSRSRSYSPRRRDSYRRRDDSRDRGRGRDRSPPPRVKSPSFSPEHSPPSRSVRSSRGKKRRNRSGSRSPSPKAYSSLSPKNSRGKKRRNKSGSRSPSPKSSRGKKRRNRSGSRSPSPKIYSPSPRSSRGKKRRNRSGSRSHSPRNHSPSSPRNSRGKKRRNRSGSRSLSPKTHSPSSPRSSRGKKRRNRSGSRSLSPKTRSPSERSSKRKSKHSKKHRHRRRHKSHSPSPMATDDPKPDMQDKQVEQEPDQHESSAGSRDSPPDRADSDRGSEGESSEVDDRMSANGEKEDVDSDSSYD